MSTLFWNHVLSQELEVSQKESEDLISERVMLRILASLGTQMSAFVHEVNSLIVMAEHLDAGFNKVRQEELLPAQIRLQVANLHGAIGDLTRNLGRQASYLTDVISIDVRRRRSRLSFSESFEVAKRLVDRQAADRSITIENSIPSDLKSIPMFPAELTTIFSNLLTNAVKSAGDNGYIRVKVAMLGAYLGAKAEERVWMITQKQ